MTILIKIINKILIIGFAISIQIIRINVISYQMKFYLQTYLLSKQFNYFFNQKRMRGIFIHKRFVSKLLNQIFAR